MVRRSSRSWIVSLAVAVLLSGGVPAQAVVVPEGNCCCAGSAGGSVCSVEDAFFCTSGECTFLGNEPCPEPSEPCPTPQTGNCCCPVTGGGSSCGPLDQFSCAFSECVFLGGGECPAEAEPCPLETGNCCCQVSGGGNACFPADGLSCELNAACTFLGDRACPPTGEQCPKPNGETCGDNVACQNVCIQETCADPANVGEPCDPGDDEDCIGDAVCEANGLCADRTPCTSDEDCPDEDTDDCQGSACDRSTGFCIQRRLPDETPCDDSDACTTEDQCQNGVCRGIGPPICPAPLPPFDQCSTLSCDPQGSVFNCDVVTPLADGRPCTNRDRCTAGDSCQNGRCVEGVPIECPAHLICVEGECVSPVQEVITSLLPGSCAPASLNRRSRGVLPALVLGAANFDVGDVDLDSIRLARVDDERSVAPTRVALEDVGGPTDADACAAGDDFESVPDGMMDLSVKFAMREVIPLLRLECLPAGTLTAMRLSGVLTDGTAFSGIALARLLGSGCDCDGCERYVDGKCSPCPPGTICVNDGTPAGAVSTAASDTASDAECVTRCTSDADCLTSNCEECRDGVCRSRCPGQCSGRPQPCSECNTDTGTCRPCCPDAQFCPRFVLDCRFCCQEDQLCGDDGECVGCRSDDDCNVTECEACDDGVCVSRCTSGEKCILGDCRQPCESHFDCADCHVCLDLGSVNAHCAPCAAQNCDLCPFCKRCAADQECVAQRCVPRED